MAPSGRTASNKISRTTKATTRTRTRQPRRTDFKKKQQQQQSSTHTKKQEIINKVLPSSCLPKTSQESSKEEKTEISEVIDVSNSNNNSACSTPKGQKYRIPEISTCPPAPKKQRVVSNCSLRRSPLSFFVPPDLEHFFLVTL
ncbi:hypothetical protein MtrunA17_Chr3g0103421 [Medicago truncatula]|uniref:Uncharacterized protein n=1 Tax=Medicago truncatula TaxID=3880 RepID=G7J261_MEDTR|nr:cyclin-dependent protein kinase inhibitor SMR13 [Medicago truncatula]AES70724.1 hypothetical protein MTR_3g061570 [Medicago truncatula]AFK34014.1 unknown [Medicago truncatula]RHN67505.1 hypothetical protein MtrunA17_Chr3g0103421 [Medicago truncatula]